MEFPSNKSLERFGNSSALLQICLQRGDIRAEIPQSSFLSLSINLSKKEFQKKKKREPSLGKNHDAMLLFLCYEDTQRVMVNFSPPPKKKAYMWGFA